MRQMITVAIMALMALACQNRPEARMETANMMKLEQADSMADSASDEEQISADTIAYSAPAAAPLKAQNNLWQDVVDQLPANANLVKKASLDLEVKDLGGYRQQLQENLARHGGYVEQEQMAKINEIITSQLTLKVPSVHFESLVQALEAGAHAVSRKSTSTEEVSQQIFEAKARAISQAALRQRYMDLIPKAKTTESLLEIEQGIHAATTEVELAKSRAAMLRSQTQYSTILLNLSPLASSIVTEPTGFFHQVRQAVAQGWRGLSGLLIVGLSVWPLWIVVGLAAWLWRRQIVRKSIAGKLT